VQGAKNRFLSNLIAMKFFSSAILLVVLSLVRAQEDPKQTGNCVSGKIGFNPDRILNNQANSSKIDETKYDMTIDYAASNVVIGPNGANLMLTKIGDGSTAAQGVRMSTTRYIHYGRFSVEMAAIPVGGVVTTFITMSPVQDEIDW
jgi:beta-glucanase (GH16 family)